MRIWEKLDFFPIAGGKIKCLQVLWENVVVSYKTMVTFLSIYSREIITNAHTETLCKHP